MKTPIQESLQIAALNVDSANSSVEAFCLRALIQRVTDSHISYVFRFKLVKLYHLFA